VRGIEAEKRPIPRIFHPHPPLPRRGGERFNEEKPEGSNQSSFFLSAKAISGVSWKMGGMNPSQVEKPIKKFKIPNWLNPEMPNLTPPSGVWMIRELKFILPGLVFFSGTWE
jgi:hypothetical protein